MSFVQNSWRLRSCSEEVDEKWWRAGHVRAKLFCVAEAELEKVDRHEGQKHEALQADEYIQQDGQHNVFLDDVGWQTEAGPIRTDVKVPVTVKAVRPHENVGAADWMNSNTLN